MSSNIIYFSLRDSIYAARFDHAIIILDSDLDTYFSIIGEAAQYLLIILQNTFIQDIHGTYHIIADDFDQEQLHFWILHFCERQFIRQSAIKNSKLIASPLKEGGLCDYRWDTKPSWNPFGHASLWYALRAWIMLARIHRLIKRSGTKELLSCIHSYGMHFRKKREPTDQEVTALASAIDAASLLYPHKTFCLAWAATYVCMSLKLGWAAHLVIGIQTNPFYAHAWAESKGKVVHDDPEIAHVLSILLKTHPNRGE